MTDPFGVLGLSGAADLTDDDVRAAWRAVAASTHPDRDDGGDPERFAAAASAYTRLRTGQLRGVALASTGLRRPQRGPAWRAAARLVAACAGRLTTGRPGRLVVRTSAAAGAAAGGFLAAGGGAAGLALVTGAATWLLVTAHHDLGPPWPPGQG